MRVSWLFGLVGGNLLPRKKKPTRRPRKAARRGWWHGKAPDIRYALSLLSTRGLLPAVLRLGRRTLRSLRTRHLVAHLRVGLDDPADTGTMWGLLWPALALPASSLPIGIRVEPAFDGPALALALEGEVRVIPALVVGNVVRFVFSPAGLRLARTMVMARWKRRK